MLGLAKQYFSRGKNGFTSAIITGERRVGKTMYSLLVIYEICRKKGMGKSEAWRTALNSIAFTMQEVIDVVVESDYRRRRDFMIWDDAGVYGAGILYFYNYKDAMVLKGIMDTIGTKVRMLLLTCPDSSGLMKFLRGYGDYMVHIAPFHKTYYENGRLATVKKPYMAKNMARRWGRAWSDEYNVKIPDRVYEKYIEKRDNYTNTVIKELRNYGRRGEEVIRENFELAGQDSLLADMVQPDSEGDES